MQHFLATLMVIGFGFLSEAYGADCSGLTSLKLDYTEITSVKSIPAGPYIPPGTTTPIAGGNLPALCELQATIRPTADSAIEILVWLPTEWNGKYQQLGNNGFGGIFKYVEMAENVRRGYAVASTDTGHKGAVFDVRWAFDHPAKVTDFVWRGARELTLKAKRIIAAYYGTSVRYSYWNGCSNGGGEGLMQAQRFPDEFDGIISGGAAAYWTRAATQQLYISRQLINNKVSDAQIDAVNKAVIKACDANDGVVGDGLIGDPRRCHWSPKALICTASEDPSNCLTPAQVDTVAAIYAPLRDPVSGKVLFGGAMRGSEWQWGARRYGYNTLLPASGVANYQLAFNNPAWNGSPFDLHADAAKLDAFFSERNAIDPDLKKFKQRHGKIIQYMGWDDVAFTPGWTVEYYKMVVDKTGRGHAEKSLTGVQDFYRLYMMPGVGHCGGGPGPSLTRFDLVTALETWVERGIAPERINAKNAAGTLERPICPYPQEAVYKGVGDVAKAASFDCRSR